MLCKQTLKWTYQSTIDKQIQSIPAKRFNFRMQNTLLCASECRFVQFICASMKINGVYFIGFNVLLNCLFFLQLLFCVRFVYLSVVFFFLGPLFFHSMFMPNFFRCFTSFFVSLVFSMLSLASIRFLVSSVETDAV